MLCVIVGRDSLLWQVSSQSTFSSFTSMPPSPPPPSCIRVWAKTQSNNVRSEVT